MTSGAIEKIHPGHRPIVWSIISQMTVSPSGSESQSAVRDTSAPSGPPNSRQRFGMNIIKNENKAPILFTRARKSCGFSTGTANGHLTFAQKSSMSEAF
jgi:hypothetical protein